MTWPRRAGRPLIPKSYESAKASLFLYTTIHAPEPVEEFSLLCALRGWYGGYFRAAWAVFLYAIEHYRDWYANGWYAMGLRLRWYRFLGLTEEQIDEKFR